MNLTDLTVELQERAATVGGGVPASSRLAEVHRRVRLRRRRHAAAVLGALAAGAVAVGGVTVLGSAHQALAPAREGPAPTSPLVFPSDDGGDRLLGSVVGRAGETDVSVRFTPEEAGSAISAFCLLAPGTSTGPGLAAQITVNGHRAGQAGCGFDSSPADPLQVPLSDPAANDPAFGRLDEKVGPGRVSAIRVRLVDEAGRPLSVPGVRLGVGVYALTGPRAVSDGVTLKRRLDVGGHRYRLDEFRTAPVTPVRRSLTVDIPAGRSPGYVIAGNDGGPWKQDLTYSLLVDGRDVLTDTGGGLAGTRLDDARAHRLELRLEPGLGGTLVLAYYVPIE